MEQFEIMEKEQKFDAEHLITWITTLRERTNDQLGFKFSIDICPCGLTKNGCYFELNDCGYCFRSLNFRTIMDYSDIGYIKSVRKWENIQLYFRLWLIELLRKILITVI